MKYLSLTRGAHPISTVSDDGSIGLDRMPAIVLVSWLAAATADDEDEASASSTKGCSIIHDTRIPMLRADDSPLTAGDNKSRRTYKKETTLINNEHPRIMTFKI